MLMRAKACFVVSDDPWQTPPPLVECSLVNHLHIFSVEHRSLTRLSVPNSTKDVARPAESLELTVQITGAYCIVWVHHHNVKENEAAKRQHILLQLYNLANSDLVTVPMCEKRCQ